MALATRERPETSLAYAERAGAHALAAGIKLDLGDRPGAKASYLKALAADESDLEALDGLARLTKDASYAERAERSAAARPAWLRSPAFRLCARLWSDLGQEARAAAAYRRAVDADPEDIAALTALVALKRARPGAAVAPTAPPAARDAELSDADAERALAKDPQDLAALRRMIELARARGAVAAATALTERLQEAAWDAPLWSQENAFRLAGRVWVELGELDRATHSLRPAREFQPLSIESMRLETIAIRRHGGYTAFDGSLAWAHLAVARAYAELGDAPKARKSYAGAEAVLNEALKTAPGDALATRILGDIAAEKSRLP